ncbi:hypothetical protein LPTSP4_09070 [Leptospira ryugenii]|uniref:Uncharacterized protein n=1 Tax=Leptospira ryugenii TaxID=1917863 RepID=A0A2P2DXN2_9LEPT|nr:hypothetical protein [Leptospira ryugenii]GBF49394.1 hypothetical protein LPTSP4_09070 [Leptospira ryugenii]
MPLYTDTFFTQTKYKTQRDNINPYTIEDGIVYDLKGKKLFLLIDFEKYEHLLFDRSSKCFLSAGSMFCGALKEKEIIKDEIDEVAYEIALDNILKKGETRFHWEAHKRLLNNLLKDTDFTFDYEVSSMSGIIERSVEEMPFMCSLYIKPWYPSGKGHLTLFSGKRNNYENKFIGGFLKDPFGKLLTGYKDHDGDNCFIPIEDLRKAIKGPAKSPCHIGFIKKRKK